MSDGEHPPGLISTRMTVANGCLHVLHVAVIVFSCVGWLSPATRPAHLVLAGLIACSWFVLGPLIGHPGFCALTGIQHRVWDQLGRTDRPNYMSFLYRKMTGRHPLPGRVEIVTQLTFYGTTAASITLFLLNG